MCQPLGRGRAVSAAVTVRVRPRTGKRPEVLERLSVACTLEPEPSSATQPASTTSRPGATTSDARDDDDDADSVSTRILGRRTAPFNH